MGKEMPAVPVAEIPTADWPVDRVPYGESWTDDFYRRTYPRLFARFIAPHAKESAPTDGAITHDRFWEIIEQARRARSSNAAAGVVAALETAFETGDAAEVIGFYHWLTTYNDALRARHDLRGAATALFGAADADTSAGFRGWLLSQGRAIVSLALHDLDALAGYSTDPICVLPTMLYVTWKRLGSSGPGREQDLEIPDRETWSADWPSTAASLEPAACRTRLPRLAAKGDTVVATYPQSDRDAMALDLLKEARAMSAAGDDRGAVEILGRAVLLRPTKGNVLVERAIVLARLGDPEAAIRDLDTAIETVPSNARALFERAMLLEARGERARALENARNAAKHGSREAETWLAAASIPKRVRHKKFGDGVVVQVEETPEGQKLEIEFANGRKKLLSTFVEIVD
jgi:tetratricopeptide (TPR) repeat protein